MHEKQCIICGDPEQLGTVVNSIRESPPGAQLAISASNGLEVNALLTFLTSLLHSWNANHIDHISS